MESGGAWLGFTQSGRFACIQLPTEPFPPTLTNQKQAIFREHLVTNFLLAASGSFAYIMNMVNHPILTELEPFYLVLGDGKTVSFFNHTTRHPMENPPSLLPKGIYVIGNQRNSSPSNSYFLDRVTESFTSIVSAWWSNVRGENLCLLLFVVCYTLISHTLQTKNTIPVLT
jgi:uncharacterized protein with NRDE domain